MPGTVTFGDMAMVDPDAIKAVADHGTKDTLAMLANYDEMVSTEYANLAENWEGPAAEFYLEKLTTCVNRVKRALDEYRTYPQELYGYVEGYVRAMAEAQGVADTLEQEVAALTRDFVEDANWANV